MKTTSILATLIFTIFLLACASDQEKEAFAQIGDYYNAEVNFTKGFSSKEGEKTQNFISLKIKNSPYLKRIKPDQLSVYAAVMLYEKLSDEERGTYTHIKVSFFDDSNPEASDSLISYSIETVKNIASKSRAFEKTADLLVNGSEGDVYDMLSAQYQKPQEKERFTNGIKGLKSKRNGVNSVKLLGVKALVNADTKERYLSYNGEIAWGNDSNTSMSVRTFENPTQNDIIHLNIK